MSVDPDESFLTVAEVAEWLKVNPQTVRNWIEHGRLPAVRVGRRVRIKRSDLERILEAGYRGGAAPPSPRPAGPSAEDFWSGEPVGIAEPDPAAPPADSGGSSDEGVRTGASPRPDDAVGEVASSQSEGSDATADAP